MFPNTITIYRHNVLDGADVYEKQILNGFYWYGKAVQSATDKGVENSAQITVVSSPKMAQSYGDKWTVQVGDIIIKGKGDDIKSLRELSNQHIVDGVEVNVCSSDVDNIVISGK